MEYFEDQFEHRIDYRLFVPEMFSKRFPGFPEETYEYMADKANAKYYKSELLDELLVKVLFPKYNLNR